MEMLNLAVLLFAVMTCVTSEKCVDRATNCRWLKENNYCNIVKSVCRKTCGVCEAICVDTREDCNLMLQMCYVRRTRDFMERECSKSCGCGKRVDTSKQQCEGRPITCPVSKRCIKESNICDGEEDCTRGFPGGHNFKDLFDETNCTVPFDPRIVGQWSMTPTDDKAVPLVIDIDENGLVREHIYSRHGKFNNGYIRDSDKQDVFPTSQGWFKFTDVRDGSRYKDCWEYMRVVESGTAQDHFFCKKCDGVYKGLNNYCGFYKGKRDNIHNKCPGCRPVKCPMSGVCIPDSWVCNGHNDCTRNGDWKNDLFDEAHCAAAFDPRFVGKWTVSDTDDEDPEDPITFLITANGIAGELNKNGYRYKMRYLKNSDDQDDFPVSQGWVKLTNARDGRSKQDCWEYLQLVNDGEFQDHLFCRKCEGVYKEKIDNYCGLYKGTVL